jgi:hypothetical protein
VAVSHARLDLGEGRPGQQLEGAFTVTNEGTQPLKFKISASRGCSFVRPMGGTLPPGASRAIRVGLRLPATVGSEKNTQVVVESNDPRQPRVSLLASAGAPAPWELSEPQMNFGYVLRRELAHPPRREVIVRPGKGKHGLPTSAIRLQVPSEAYEVVSRKRRDGSLAIEVSLRADLADGRYSATLYVGHADDPMAIGIPLDAEVGAGVTFAPPVVRLRVDAASGAYRPTRLYVLARKPGLLIGRVRAHHVPSGIHLRDTGGGPARRRLVEIHFDPGVRLAAAGVALVVSCDGVPGTFRLQLMPPALHANGGILCR